MRALLFAVILAAGAAAHAAIEARSFDDPGQRQLYEELIAELRCLVCQNQNLESSNADLAKDLRAQIHDMIRQGASRDEIVTYMTDRYGEFVLYRPPFRTTTALLWAGPALLLLTGLVIVVVVARRRAAAGELSPDERERARRLLGD